MSEGFDREAERERLRRQLEEEEEDRKATQQMSDLLLKGATMTNKHCEECGDPIFRYDGQEFCPTCQRPVASGSADADAAATATTAPETAPADADGADDGTAATAPGDDRTKAASGPTPEREQASSTPNVDTTPMAGAASGTAAGDLDAARASLLRTLTALASQAEATDDVGRTRDLLAAAKEAAQALAALEPAHR